jgi:hypothetical protein
VHGKLFVISILCGIIAIILTLISWSLRLLASGVKITNNVIRYKRHKYAQRDTLDDVVDGTSALIKLFSKIILIFRNILAGIAGFGGTLTTLVVLLVVAAVSAYSVVLADDLQTAVDSTSDTSDTCSNAKAVGGYWEELDVCYTKDDVQKINTPLEDISLTTSDQYKLIHEDPNFSVDEYGLARLYDEDLDIYFFGIAWSYTYNAGIGEKYRVTLEKEDGSTNYVYVFMLDLRRMEDSRPDDNEKYKWCYNKYSAIMEFYVDRATYYKNFPEVVNDPSKDLTQINYERDIDEDHMFAGPIVKIEHYLGIDGSGDSLDDIRKGNTEFNRVEAEVIKSKYADGKTTKSTSKSCEKSSTINSVDGRIIWVGDSRTVGLESGCKYNGQWDDDKDIAFGIISGTYSSFTGDLPNINAILESGDTIVINYGVNDLWDADLYIEKLNELAEGDWKGHDIIFMSVNPLVYDLYKANYTASTYTENSVADFNEQMKEGLASSITYLDTYTYINEDIADISRIEAKDGLHWSTASNEDGEYPYQVYGYLYDAVRAGKGTVVTRGVDNINIDFSNRFYTYNTDGVYGSPSGQTVTGTATLPESYSSTAYASGRAWEVLNYEGTDPMPTKWVQQALDNQELSWSDGSAWDGEVSLTTPLYNSILLYTVDGEAHAAFVENIVGGSNILLSWTSEKEEVGYGFNNKWYDSVDDFLKEQNGTLVCYLKPNEDGR